MARGTPSKWRKCGRRAPALPTEGVAAMLRARPRAVEDEVPLAVDDEEIAARDLDRQKPVSKHVEALHGGENADDPRVDVADRDHQRDRQRVAEVRLVDLGHVRLPDTAHAEVPVTKRVASTVDLRRVGRGRPDDPRPIREEDPVHLGEAFVELAQMYDRLPRVLMLDTFAEPEASRIGLQDVQVALFSGLDRGGDAPGERVLC